MKRQGKTYNKKNLKTGQWVASWGVSGMNWKEDQSKKDLMILCKRLRSSRELSEKLGKLVMSQPSDFLTQSGATAMIETVMGDSTRMDYLLACQD